MDDFDGSIPYEKQISILDQKLEAEGNRLPQDPQASLWVHYKQFYKFHKYNKQFVNYEKSVSGLPVAHKLLKALKDFISPGLNAEEERQCGIIIGISAILCRCTGPNLVDFKEELELVKQFLFAHLDDPFVTKNCFWALRNFTSEEEELITVDRKLFDTVISALTRFKDSLFLQRIGTSFLCRTKNYTWIKENGGVEPIMQVMEYFKHNCKAATYNMLWLFRSASLMGYEQTALEWIIEIVTKYKDDNAIQANGCTVMSLYQNLSPENQEFVTKVGFIDLVIQTMIANPDVAKIQSAGCNGLAYYCNGAKNAESLQEKGGLDLVFSALTAHSAESSVQGNGCNALLSFAFASKDMCLQIVQKGGIERLMEAMKNHNEEVTVIRNALHTMRNLVCLLADEEHSRTLIKQGVLDCVLKVMKEKSQPELQSLCCIILQSFGTTAGYAQLIVDSGGIELICAMLHKHVEDKDAQENGAAALRNIASYREFFDGSTNYHESLLEHVVLAALKFPKSEKAAESAYAVLLNFSYYYQKPGRLLVVEHGGLDLAVERLITAETTSDLHKRVIDAFSTNLDWVDVGFERLAIIMAKHSWNEKFGGMGKLIFKRACTKYGMRKSLTVPSALQNSCLKVVVRAENFSTLQLPEELAEEAKFVRSLHVQKVALKAKKEEEAAPPASPVET